MTSVHEELMRHVTRLTEVLEGPVGVASLARECAKVGMEGDVPMMLDLLADAGRVKFLQKGKLVRPA